MASYDTVTASFFGNKLPGELTEVAQGDSPMGRYSYGHLGRGSTKGKTSGFGCQNAVCSGWLSS